MKYKTLHNEANRAASIIALNTPHKGEFGIAWINIRRCAFSTYLKSVNVGRYDSLLGGVTICVSRFDTLNRNMKYAQTYVNLIGEAGITSIIFSTYPTKRMHYTKKVYDKRKRDKNEYNT